MVNHNNTGKKEQPPEFHYTNQAEVTFLQPFKLTSANTEDIMECISQQYPLELNPQDVHIRPHPQQSSFPYFCFKGDAGARTRKRGTDEMIALGQLVEAGLKYKEKIIPLKLLKSNNTPYRGYTVKGLNMDGENSDGGIRYKTEGELGVLLQAYLDHYFKGRIFIVDRLRTRKTMSKDGKREVSVEAIFDVELLAEQMVDKRYPIPPKHIFSHDGSFLPFTIQSSLFKIKQKVCRRCHFNQLDPEGHSCPKLDPPNQKNNNPNDNRWINSYTNNNNNNYYDNQSGRSNRPDQDKDGEEGPSHLAILPPPLINKKPRTQSLLLLIQLLKNKVKQMRKC